MTSGLIQKWASAIQQMEWGGKTPTNNNPGNLKGSGWQGQVGSSSNGIAIFSSFADGWNALIKMLTNDASGYSSIYSPSDTLYTYYAKYAPASDNNDPVNYANFVANYLGVSPDAPISQLV